MSIVLFNVLPQMADITVACIYLATAMQPWAAAIVAVTVASYVPLTVIITERRGEVRPGWCMVSCAAHSFRIPFMHPLCCAGGACG